MDNWLSWTVQQLEGNCETAENQLHEVPDVRQSEVDRLVEIAKHAVRLAQLAKEKVR